MGLMTSDDIAKLGELAKIEIKPEEAESFKKDFDSILGYIKSIESVDIGEVSTEYLVKNVMRKDANPNESSSNTEALLKAAPETYDGFVKVNKIL
jgi:aspartyl-tRNA(Asn)/glutamyl-tRNA(Gln) amidotransferase subunit C